MSLPAVLRRRIEERFGAVGSVQRVSGGCINRAVRVALPGGDAFLKFNHAALPGFFAAEVAALEALRGVASGLRIPKVLGTGEGDADEPAWLLLEWLEPAERDGSFGARLGRGLAVLHRAQSGGWGWEEDGFIGPLPQQNDLAENWPSFWREHRLEPQLRLAHHAGRMPGTAREWDQLFARFPDLLAPAATDGPSLLHGDLWSGNVLAVWDGEGAAPALVDPATYRGHREVDLAMAELFGGFDAPFYAAYRETWPLQPGYREGRRAVYQLYYLLVHTNLFGGGYRGQAERALRLALAG